MFERITFDPHVMGGRACIRGMRITVSLVVNLAANGMTTDEILAEYPDLEAEDIRDALTIHDGCRRKILEKLSDPAMLGERNLLQDQMGHIRSQGIDGEPDRENTIVSHVLLGYVLSGA